MTIPLYERLRQHWQAASCRLALPASPAEIASFESQYKIRVPREFEEYLLRVNGMDDYDCDEECIYFHNLARIARDWEWYESESDDFVDVVFADFLINSHYYSVRLARSGDCLGIWCLDGTNALRLNSTFDEFMESYLADRAKMAIPW